MLRAGHSHTIMTLSYCCLRFTACLLPAADGTVVQVWECNGTPGEKLHLRFVVAACSFPGGSPLSVTCCMRVSHTYVQLLLLQVVYCVGQSMVVWHPCMSRVHFCSRHPNAQAQFQVLSELLPAYTPLQHKVPH